MAINYKPMGWSTADYINPTNMNHMDDGIKAACDGVDAVNENLAKLPKTKYISEDKSVLSIAENGKYYCLNAKDLPANEDTYGYLDVTVHPNNSNYRVIRYTPINSNEIHQNILHDGTWQGWESFAKNSALSKLAINKKTLTATLSVGGNVSIGINKARPLFGIYTDTSAGNNGIALTPYAISTSTDWYVHAISTGNNEVVANQSIDITIYYGEVQ